MAQFLLPRTGIGMDVHAFATEGSGVPMHLGLSGVAGGDRPSRPF